MQIIATPLPSGAAVTLGDDATGDYIVDPQPLPVERRAAQVESLAFAARKVAIGRGNRQTSFSWTVARLHASLAAADTFAWNHAAGVPVNCSLQITVGTTVLTYSSAVIDDVTITEQLGKSTKTRYTVKAAIFAS